MKDNQRIALTKRLLQEGLLRLMKSKPLDKISVSELCKEAGINRATFYRHYDLPRDVLDDIEHQLIGGLNIDLCQVSGLRDIVRYCESTLEYICAHADLLKVLLQNRSDEEFTRIINDMCERIWALKANLQIVKDMDMDGVKLLSAYSVGGVYFLLRQWLLGDIQKTPQEVSQLILQMMNIICSTDV